MRGNSKLNRRTTVLAWIGIFLLAAVSLDAASIQEFRKRNMKLKEMKAKCESISDPSKQQSCLSKYQKEAGKYKKDLAKFKQEAALENRARQEARAKSGSKSLQEDIAKRNESIREFQDFVSSSCNNTTSNRCASALYQLGNLTYANEEDGFRAKQTKYEKDMQRWEDHDQKGPEPVAPRRDHSGSLQYFERLLQKYPNYSEIPLVYYRLAFIWSIQGDDEKSYQFLSRLVTEFPNHGLTVPAQLRIGEHFLLQRKYRKAIEAYEKVPSSYQGPEAGLALYHKAEAYYNMADFETAAKYYYEYVIKAEKGILKGDLKTEALEFMAACWADMDDGVEVAHRFLKGKGHSWEKDIYFLMGEKNKGHDRLDEARKAFEHLLRVDPNYPQAPTADMAIVSMLVVQKRGDEAQKHRLKLVERYKQGSPWYSANSNNKSGKENATKAVKAARFQIPVYYHFKATKDKDNVDKGLLKKAAKGYQEYLAAYDEDSWEVYEAHQNLGSVYHQLGNYAKAAAEFKWCSNAPVDKYGKMPPEKKKSLVTTADAAYNRVYMLDLDRARVLKEADSNAQKVYNAPQTQAYFSAVEDYMDKFGQSNSAPDVAYNAAVVHYNAKQYGKAIVALEELNENFPNHKHSNLIRRMLGQSLLEDGEYVKSEKVFTELLKRLGPSHKDYKDVQLSVASAIFKQADAKVKDGQPGEAADLYLRMVDKHPQVDIADKALFEAGIQYEAVGDVSKATSTLMSLHGRYPKSTLRIKSILRAAAIYRKAEQYRDAASTFLVIRDKFPKDSTAFQSIGWAAEAYEKVPDLALAARTYESSVKHFPDNVKTPSYLYNAGQTYEELKDFGNAIRVYDLLGSKYPKSNFAIEAVFSVPLIQEKQGNYKAAAQAYREFISKYKSDPQKLIRAQLAAGKLYDQKLNDDKIALGLYEDVKQTFEANADKDIPVAIPAEAAYLSGQMFYDKIREARLDGSAKANARTLKNMAANLEKAIEHYTYAVEKSEQEWTLRSTMRMGDIFMTFAEVTGNETIRAKDATERVAQQIGIKKGLPNFYDKARGLYQKNLDLAKEQGFEGPYVDTAGVRYLETYYLKAKVYEDIGSILMQSPMPEGYSPEEIAEYKAALEDKRYEFEQAAKPIYATGLKAAQFYALDNEYKDKMEESLRALDPQAPELNLEAYAQDVNFVDNQYKSNMEKINSIYENPSWSDKKKKAELAKIEEAAKTEVKRLTAELENLRTAQGEQ